MKILFDHNVDRRFRQQLPGHEIQTARERGWDKLENGVLLRAAADGGFGDPGEASFDRVEDHRAVSEIVVGEAFDVAPDPFGVFDDMFEPPPLAFGQHFRRQAPGPGRSRFASLASAQVRRPDR